MEWFEKSEEILDYLPSGFLKKLNSAEELWDLDEYDLMVRVVATEADRLSREGKERVAHVIMNRLKHPNVGVFGGFDIKSVIEKPGAFKTMDIARTPDSTMKRIKDPSLRSRYRSIKSKILDPQQHIPKRALAEALKVAGGVYFDGKEDNTGGATNLYSNTVSGDKKAGGIGGNILSINKEDIGSEDDPLGPGFEGDPEGNSDSGDDPLGPGFEGDPEGDSGSDPKGQGSSSDADTGKYYPYTWREWEGETINLTALLGQVVVIEAINLNIYGVVVFVEDRSHPGKRRVQKAWLRPYRGTHIFKFTAFGAQPITWKFRIYPNREAGDVKIFLSISSTWVPGMKREWP